MGRNRGLSEEDAVSLLHTAVYDLSDSSGEVSSDSSSGDSSDETPSSSSGESESDDGEKESSEEGSDHSSVVDMIQYESVLHNATTARRRGASSFDSVFEEILRTKGEDAV
eukprot:GDKK01068566.1.p1 GENE.GDKK01068566.1~~GDKK01068566.1.p1  ORF type:complete len:111 (-),score=16.36 GDKK01068566.1:109-441(-)